MPDFFAAPNRFTIAVRETKRWILPTLLYSLPFTLVVRASTQHYGKSHTAWTEVGIDMLMVTGCWLFLLIVGFVWNFIFAPARLQREAKRQAGLASLNEVLTANAEKAVKGTDKLMDDDEEDEDRSED
jgi:hypothetical protein